MPSLAELRKRILEEQEVSKKENIIEKEKIIPDNEKSKKSVDPHIKVLNKPKKTKKDYIITSDAIRTTYFLLTGKSSRKRIEDIKSDLLKILNKN